MKTSIITLILVCVSSVYCNASTLYDQLCEFNPNWARYSSEVEVEKAHDFSSESEYIQTHLNHVIPILMKADVSNLSAELQGTRSELIEVLQKYADEGVFPMNYYVNQRIPVFIDEHDTHCAVGFLIKHTGNGALAREISEEDNYVWVKDISNPEVLEWQKKSGFTLEELKLIQGAYDFYMPMALNAPDRYEIPQKPEVMTLYFEEIGDWGRLKETESVWCYGEGENGVLNGEWIQNYSATKPWIYGCFKDGKRTGRWKEYYPGSDVLCRTEHWRNDELNGVRTRFSRDGEIVEEILFKDGEAVTKTNIDLERAMKWIRQPLDSVNVWTQVYSLAGGLLAEGHEKIHNPGNLLWFQNIELTALNSAAITARDASTSYEHFIGANSGQLSFGRPQRFFEPTKALVEYKKEGEWVYYPDYLSLTSESEVKFPWCQDYFYFGAEIAAQVKLFSDLESVESFSQLNVKFEKDFLVHFHGVEDDFQVRFALEYYVTLDPINTIHWDSYEIPEFQRKIKCLGVVDTDGNKIGAWNHYTRLGIPFKCETFLIPYKEEEEALVVR